MSTIILVDGYNVIHGWSHLKRRMDTLGLEPARDRLIEMMGDYAGFTGIDVLIVFDAHMVKGSVETYENHPGVNVVYTGANEIADKYIERILSDITERYDEVVVATSDAMEQSVSLGLGATRRPVRELLEDVTQARLRRSQLTDTVIKTTTNPLMDRIHPDVARKLERMRKGELDE